jgi:hypothetical protein
MATCWIPKGYMFGALPGYVWGTFIIPVEILTESTGGHG